MSFFFQAEDGIRDLTVTGVQTCALPISLQEPDRLARLGAATVAAQPAGAGQGTGRVAGHAPAGPVAGRERRPERSEERRVGEGGRSRWAPYHLKKKDESGVSAG